MRRLELTRPPVADGRSRLRRSRSGLWGLGLFDHPSHDADEIPSSIVGQLPNEHSTQTLGLGIVALDLNGLDAIVSQDQVLLLVPQPAPDGGVVKLITPVRVVGERLLDVTVIKVTRPAHVVLGGIPSPLDAVALGGHVPAHPGSVRVVEHVTVSGYTEVELRCGDTDLLELSDGGRGGDVTVQGSVVGDDLGPVSSKVLRSVEVRISTCLYDTLGSC